MEAFEFLMPDKEAPDKTSNITVAHYLDSRTQQRASIMKLPISVRNVLLQCIANLDVWTDTVVQILCCNDTQKIKISTSSFTI